MMTVLCVFRQCCVSYRNVGTKHTAECKIPKDGHKLNKNPCENQENYNKQVIESFVQCVLHLTLTVVWQNLC